MGAWQGIGRRALIARALIAGLASVLAFSVAGATPARASDTEQSILMDDSQLIYASPAHVEQTLERIAELGIDRVKVSMVWSLIAPDPNSSTPPQFDATDPNAYPQGVWDRYDLVDEVATQLGLGVYWQLTGPAPSWAVTPTGVKKAHSWSHMVDAPAFGQFVQAVGARYDGSFVPPSSEPAPPPFTIPVDGLTPSGVAAGSIAATAPLGATLPVTTTLTGNSGVTGPAGNTGTATTGAALPAVTWWGIWNEPNELAWLSPQFRGRDEPYSPGLYRRMLDAAWSALAATGHEHDTIMLGETASGGTIGPIPFVRDLYCVSANDRPLSGRSAARMLCPTSGSRSAFVVANPGLFEAAGFAHHPYSFDQPPNLPFKHEPNIITLANLGGLEKTLDRIFVAYGHKPGIPLYLTEWGYKTNPPNPFAHTSLNQQATWLNEGEFMTWSDSRIRALAQFLLVDDLPRAGARPGTLSYWSTFQSGLMFADGTQKPSYGAFRLPIWLPDPHTGPAVTVWAQVRPADHSQVSYAELEFRSVPSASWGSLTELQTSSQQGYIYTHVALPARGQVRLEWLDPSTGDVDYSRTVSVG
jgi:hypothetical protein